MDPSDSPVHHGSCLCGDIRFAVTGPLPPPDACHCTMCRKQSGHFWASTDVPQDAVVIEGSEHVRWFQSSETVRRGFCARCGSTLFWEPRGGRTLAIAMGAFDGHTGASLHAHLRRREG